ncbi:hypothetical protein FSP39_012185 [Pinctada imbricata]|uniref:Uncharacterized protein n=1 Tax=Pinctada imbricata TaxID=66713 RepID=A0AA88XP33_PINIB|nr:hypothetical protein FSP39_012185 [Pinctada imbricata]
MLLRQEVDEKNKNISGGNKMVSFLGTLPSIESVSSALPAVVLDYMTESQLTETYHMIQKAAKYGHGFGFQEFSSEDDFRNEISGSRCFAVTCKEEGTLLASLILAQSKFYRGSDQVVDPYIIVKYSDRCKGLGEFCMRQAIKLSVSFGYIAMYIDTFANNVAILRIIDKIGGFQQVGCLPVGGCLPCGKFVPSIIFYRNLLIGEENNNT